MTTTAAPMVKITAAASAMAMPTIAAMPVSLMMVFMRSPQLGARCISGQATPGHRRLCFEKLIPAVSFAAAAIRIPSAIWRKPSSANAYDRREPIASPVFFSNKGNGVQQAASLCVLFVLTVAYPFQVVGRIVFLVAVDVVYMRKAVRVWHKRQRHQAVDLVVFAFYCYPQIAAVSLLRSSSNKT